MNRSKSRSMSRARTFSKTNREIMDTVQLMLALQLMEDLAKRSKPTRNSRTVRRPAPNANQQRAAQRAIARRMRR